MVVLFSFSLALDTSIQAPSRTLQAQLAVQFDVLFSVGGSTCLRALDQTTLSQQVEHGDGLAISNRECLGCGD